LLEIPPSDLTVLAWVRCRNRNSPTNELANDLDSFDSTCLQGGLIYSRGLEKLRNVRNGVNARTPWGRAQLTLGAELWEQLYGDADPWDTRFGPGAGTRSLLPGSVEVPQIEPPIIELPEIFP
jgi:hypothetical protein